jgi:putative colanic acid biosynthesis UDP-glucose lipid carrier transferase
MEGMMSPERLRNIFKICQRQGVRILVYSYWEDLLNYPLAPVSEGDTTFFTLGEEPLENPVNRFVKRTFDILFSLPVCILILPILWWVRLKQKKESPGPLFFRQLRAGKDGKPFQVLKIRTMHVRENDAADDRQAKVGDERVYKFGEWLRKTSLDELPQFINVLRGEMSVVGPRPHMLAHDSKFAELVEMYRSRFFVKPGITGLAQVNGFRGEIQDLEVLEKRIRYDIEYITHWSLWLDIVIVVKTAITVIKPQKSAY